VGNPLALWLSHVELPLSHQSAVFAIEVPVAMHLAIFIFALGL